jgi:hypothetical protein
MAHALHKSDLSKHAECGKPRNDLSFIRGGAILLQGFFYYFL